ncbi:hypothetical protein HOK68_03310 [Candidatus Woesearchaeota archaeon]|jgi:hypothetical protein|nr:hypothetical protein [Candidatus Woesearchaeota archaeon]MBT4387733.1 hypothetical protein [Candidatus Woesearchaeota archaeon]MBT4595552.1 hypothetical protein [Candidatus Woesearchaeota archaeon]MBT5740965.1 hypothetical protein [Candidatus Woesearchaeota archaeon]MBT6505782.1 hypothetical protein [Candidatus Woesearchaeota archaeon]
MVYDIRRNLRYSFNIKGFLAGDDIRGVMKFNSIGGMDSIENICANFIFGRETNCLTLFDSSLYFYGTFNQLEKNYRRGTPFKPCELEQMKDKDHKFKYGGVNVNMTEFGFFKIPLYKLNLSKNQKQLIDILFLENSSNLFDLTSGLEQVEIDFKHQGFNTMFSHFPKFLTESILKTKSYFTKQDTIKNYFSETSS